MAMQMGFLEKEQTKQKSSGLQELKAQRYSIEDKSRSVTFHPPSSQLHWMSIFAPLPTIRRLLDEQNRELAKLFLTRSHATNCCQPLLGNL
jgi:hypothetical protein